MGRAVGANPISIVIPCHRVIGSGGTLTGYGGGLWVELFRTVVLSGTVGFSDDDQTITTKLGFQF